MWTSIVRSRTSDCVGAPDRVEELVAAEDAAVGLEQRLEEPELDVGQLDGRAGDRDLVAGRVEDEAVVADPVAGRARRPARRRAPASAPAVPPGGGSP